MTLTVGEFIRRFLMHVLPKRFHRIRHYGLFANGARAENITRARELLKVAAADREPASTNTDDLVHSHRCPCCGGRMIIVETFEPGTTPRTRPAALALTIGFDSS
jgi:Putative transposase